MLLGLAGCEQQELPFAETAPGIYFDGGQWSFTFRDVPGKNQDTIKIPMLISGDSTAYDREILAEVVQDTNTTSPADLYKVLPGKVERGKFSGMLPVVVIKPESGILNDTIFQIELRLVPSEDFTDLRMGRRTYIISFTNKIIRPANWQWLSYYFGTYSTNWWEKIMEWTGKSSLPYYPNHPDQETWNMPLGEVQAYQSMVRLKLQEYNRSDQGPLIHRDGDKKGQLVVMP